MLSPSRRKLLKFSRLKHIAYWAVFAAIIYLAYERHGLLFAIALFVIVSICNMAFHGPLLRRNLRLLGEAGNDDARYRRNVLIGEVASAVYLLATLAISAWAISWHQG